MTLRRAGICALLLATLPAALEAQGRTRALIVVGLGGQEDFRQSFHEEAAGLHAALTERHGIADEDVTYLGERVERDPELIDDRSTRANILQVLGEIAQESGPMDRLLVILIGHGTSSRGEAQFNLPGPDLTPADFEMGVTAFPTQTLALVHTGSASGAFVEPLSGPNRIVVAATRSALERNATEFGQFFVEALSSDDADLDKDERTSLLEAFQYTTREVARYYEAENEMLTEHAVLDDNGDGQGTSEASIDAADGALAASFQLGGVSGTAAQTPDDPELRRLYEERAEIQQRIDQLRAVRDVMTEDEYLDELEPLLVEMAIKNREIRALEGGNG